MELWVHLRVEGHRKWTGRALLERQGLADSLQNQAVPTCFPVRDCSAQRARLPSAGWFAGRQTANLRQTTRRCPRV